MNHRPLEQTFKTVDGQNAGLERTLSVGGTLPFGETVEQAMDHAKALIIAYIREAGGKQPPDPRADILDVWKVLVKGDPSWNAIRDNCRELVYYRNCLELNRPEALPAVPEKMAVRTVRHIYLYIKTRCIREGRLED